MRWFVEISPLGQKAGPSTTLCVEAPQWQPALQKARAMRGDNGAMSNFSIELLDDGFRAIDPATRLRFVVKRAPDDAALSVTSTPAPAPAVEKPAPQVAVPAPDTKKRPLAQTVAFTSPGAAAVNPEPAPAPAARVPAAPAPEPPAPAAAVVPTPEARKRPLAQTVAFSSQGAAAVRDSAPAPEPAKPAPAVVSVPVRVGGAETPPNPPKPQPAKEPAHDVAVPTAGEPVPSFVLVGAREDNPTESSPLTYREFVYAVAQGTSEEDARRLILDRFETVLASIGQVRAGKLINLAVFDHVFHGKPQRRPLVTLTWKDWKPDPPEIRFPEREGGTPSARSLTPLGTPVVTPSAVAAVAKAAAPVVAGPAVKAAPVAAEPAAKVAAPVMAEPAPKPVVAEPAPKAAPVAVEPAPKPAGPKLSSGTLSSAQPTAQPKAEVAPEVPVVMAEGRMRGPNIRIPEVQAPQPAKAADAPATPFIKPIIAIEPAPAAPASPAASVPESRVAPTMASPVLEAAPAAPKAVAPVDPPKAAPPAAAVPIQVEYPGVYVNADAPAAPASSRAVTVGSAPSPPATPRKRLSGDDLLAELFEAFGDLQFLRDSLEGAEFVLALTLEQLPCELGLVSLFDMNTREFVVVRQSGGQGSALCARQSERAPIAGNAMRKRRAIVVSDPAGAASAVDDRFRAAGVEIRSLVTTPVELGGRYLGLIELVNPLDGGRFSEGDGNALTYIGEQFAEFVASHGVIVDPEQIRAPPKALYDGAAASGPKARSTSTASMPAVPTSKRSR